MTTENILVPTPAVSAAPNPAQAQPPLNRDDQLQRKLEKTLTEPRIPLDVGVTIGPYSLQAQLSNNGSLIWRAHDQELDRTVVIRLFNPDKWQASERGEVARAFWDGARLMAKLGRVTRCPTLLDGPAVTGGWLWFAIEYYPQLDLESSLRRGLITAPQKERVFDEIASALSELHRNDNEHRDLALSNVLVMESGDGPHAYLSDYDLSTVDRPVTLPDASPYYSADAVIDRDPSSDVRALCVLLFKLYTSSDTDVPANPTRAQLRAKLASSHTDPMVRARVARICAQGLGREGFDSAAEVRDAWRRRGAERWANVVGFMLLLCGLSMLALVLDFLVSPYVETKWVQLGSVLLGSVGVLGIFASLLNLARANVPALYGKAVEWSTAYPARAIAAAVVLASINVTIWCLTGFSERLESYYFESPKGCKVARAGVDEPLDLDSVTPEMTRGNTIRVHIPGARTLSCADTKPTYWGASFFTRALDFEEAKKPATIPPCDAKGVTAPLAMAAPSASAQAPTVPSAAASVAASPSAHPSASSHTGHASPTAVAIAAAPTPTIAAPAELQAPPLTAQQSAQVACELCNENGRSCVRDCGISYAYDPGHKAACRVYCDVTLRECRSSKCLRN